MTSNQKRAVELAVQILRDGRPAAGLCDADWELLLLAAGLTHVSARPVVTARRALRNAASGHGYFAECAGSPGSLDLALPDDPDHTESSDRPVDRAAVVGAGADAAGPGQLSA